MNSTFASSFLISLLLFASLGYARKEPAAGDYWKSIMKEKPMPRAIKDLFYHRVNEGIKTDRFVKGFDLRSSAIIYHRRSDTDTDTEEQHQHQQQQQEEEEEKAMKTRDVKIPQSSAQELNKLHD